MKLKGYLAELSSDYGKGITFFDLDETIFKTHSRVRILKGGKIVKRLRNFEFLNYTPEPGEEPDFDEYTNAKFFFETSEPIQKMVDRIKRMFQHIGQRGSKVVVLTARADLDDKQMFLETFRKAGIPIDGIFVERLGKAGRAGANIPQLKRDAIFKYLETGDYRRARLVDDSKANCRAFLELEDNLPKEIIEKVKEKYKIPDNETLPPIQFFALWAQEDGSLKRMTK